MLGGSDPREPEGSKRRNLAHISFFPRTSLTREIAAGESRGYVAHPGVSDRGLIADQKRPCACSETGVDLRDGLHVSAEPGLTHDIHVCRASFWPKACNLLTGRCKGGGLESPPTNKLHISIPGEQKFSQKLMALKACNLPMGFKFFACHSNRKESPDSGGKPGTVEPGRTGLQESYRLPKRKRTRMTICTYNARILASEAAIEDLMMQARKTDRDEVTPPAERRV
ncbi:hypothetical protein RB195_023140 [Necator americanus]|uniref:Uncharacterized protein n=1 Tax=Necator americanus TaxID=51031 RepID=A0ABR1EKK7_NECAM